MNIMEKLAREIRRVAALHSKRDEARHHEGRSSDQPTVELRLMNLALDQACVAIGKNDLTLILIALRDLEGYTE